MRLAAIRAEDEYAGVRAMLVAQCGTARLSLQIDIGVGDLVWPAPKSCIYPALLGDRNSRIKDFFDLHHLADHFEFDRATLAEAVRRTFARRGTPIPAVEPIGLTPAYWNNPSRPAQVRAFARRAGLPVPAAPDDGLGPLLEMFLLPILHDLVGGERQEGTWRPGGPW